MKTRLLITFIISFLFGGPFLKPACALEHVQKEGLFSINFPEGWHWVEAGQEVGITYPDGKTIAIDIQWVPSRELSQPEIKKAIKQANDRMIKEGILAHNGTLIDNKEIKLSGVYATQLDFKTSPPNPIHVTYFSFFNKGYAFTVTFGGQDEKMDSLMEDTVMTIKF